VFSVSSLHELVTRAWFLLPCVLQLYNGRYADPYTRYENSYKIGPPECLFNASGVELMLSELLTEMLTNHKYNAKRSACTAMDITSTARTRLKALALPR